MEIIFYWGQNKKIKDPLMNVGGHQVSKTENLGNFSSIFREK